MASLFARSAARIGRNAFPVMTKRTFAASAARFEVIKKYTREHEWISYDTDSKIATIGVSEYAASALGDVVYVELESVGTELSPATSIGTVESVKSASDIYSPISGTISEVNETLTSKPALVNQDPEGDAWMVKVQSEEGIEGVDGLMDAAAYAEHTKGGAH